MTTLTTVGYGDVNPNTTTERFFAMAMMLLGAVASAFLFGKIFIALSKFDRQGERYLYIEQMRGEIYQLLDSVKGCLS